MSCAASSAQLALHGNCAHAIGRLHPVPRACSFPPPDPSTPQIVLVNPQLLSLSGNPKLFEEGCLSFPNIYADVEVRRPWCASWAFVWFGSSRACWAAGRVGCGASRTSAQHLLLLLHKPLPWPAGRECPPPAGAHPPPPPCAPGALVLCSGRRGCGSRRRTSRARPSP